MHYGTPTPHPGVTVLDVPLQGAQVATRCPVRADLDHAPALAALRAEPDPSELTRAELTQAHVLTTWAAVTDQTRVGGLETVVIDAPDRVTREEQTRAALQGSAQVIVGAQLPDDPDGRRRGRSMLLVRPAMSEPVGWVPVEIRRHAFTRPTTSGVMYRSPLSQPFPDQASPMTGVAPRTNRHNENGLALAHGWRLLVAAGATAPGQRAQGGLVDADGTLWWVDLEDSRWSTRWSPTPVTTLAHYDHAFGFRLEVIANRLARDRDPEVPRGVVPIRIGQCATCPWERVCRDELEAEDHLSLIPRSTYDHVLAHRDRGIESRRQVARLHWPTAWLIFGDGPRSEITDVSALIEAARQLPPSAEPPAAVEADPRRRGTRHLIHHRRSWRWLRQRTARPRQPRPHVRLALDPRDPAGLASRRLRTRRRSQSPASRRRRPRPSTGSRRGDRASRPSSRPNLGSRLGLDAERRLTRPSLTDLRR